MIHTSAVTVVGAGALAPGASVRYRIAEPVDKRMDHFSERRVSFSDKAVALADKQAQEKAAEASEASGDQGGETNAGDGAPQDDSTMPGEGDEGGTAEPSEPDTDDSAAPEMEEEQP